MKIKRLIRSYLIDSKYKRAFKKRIEIAPGGLDLDENLYAFRYLCHQIEKAIKNEYNPDNVRGKEKYSKALLIKVVLEKSELSKARDFKWGVDILNKYELWSKGQYRHARDLNVSKKASINDFSQVVFERRSVRYWSDMQVEKRIIESVLNHGIMAPTSCNRQAFKITVVTNTSGLAGISGNTTNRSMIARAPHMIYVSIDRRLYPEIYAPAIDAGIICQNLLLAMQHHGLGGCPMYHSEAYNQKFLRDQLGLSDKHFIYVGIPFGYPTEEPELPVRAPLSMVSSEIDRDLSFISKNC